METNQIEHIFKSSFHFENWKEVIKTYFKNIDFYSTPIESIDKSLKYHQVAQSIKEFGAARLADDKIIKFYDIKLEDGKHVTKNRVGLRNLIHREVIPGDVDALLVVFHAPGDKDWRLTFISKSVFWDEDFNENKLETSPRRYTYVLGEDESVKTAIQQFEKLENKQITVKDLIELFNVEKLNKKFFDGYKRHYTKFWSYLSKTDKYSQLFSTHQPEKKDKKIRDFTKKLLGRIVFLYFLQKKGWLGCAPHPKKWEKGERQFLLKLLEGYENKAHFHSKCLTQLFFNTLNQPNRINDAFEVEGLNNKLNGTKVPYLNGGLFETDTEVNAKNIDFPVSYFEELFDFFGQYNFTIDENSPDDHEVGIDPEMLGHIFENLLEDNKDKGAFYTPKEIVQYMTQESLIQYLQTHLGERKEIEQLIRYQNKGKYKTKDNFIKNNAEEIEELLDKVKICDPAIGSGAFPMGMLHEIFKAKMALDWTLNRSEVKKNIIQNSIYGVDLESGAVDIARLRFWLALVVDEEEPHALPNLDYKIMQGNSLLESFEGIDLSTIHEGVAIEVDSERSGANLFSRELQKKEGVENQEKLEDLIHSYFDLNDPEAKKEMHARIDQQVLNNIYFTLNDHQADLEKEYKKLLRKIKTQSASLKKAEQKIKYETESKDAKLAKRLNTQIENIADKQRKLKELYDSNERPFFLWHLFFKEVFDKGGFDIVIGNPPYLRVQGIKDFDLEFANQISKLYESATGSYDLYAIFTERSLGLLKEKGILNFIMPVKWTNAAFGKGLRKVIQRANSMQKIISFGAHQVFNASTYTGLHWFQKDSSLLEYVELDKGLKNERDLSVFLNGLSDFSFAKIEPIRLSESPWVLVNAKTQNILNLIEKHPRSIENVFDKIFTGIQTSKDTIYFLFDCIEKEDTIIGYSKELNKQVEIEKALLKPLLKGDDVHRYNKLKTNKMVVFPYKFVDEDEHKVAKLFDELEIKTCYPLGYSYLKDVENILRKREKGRFNIDGAWFQYGRKQGINSANNEKLIAPDISLKGNFTHDKRGEFYSTTTNYGYIKSIHTSESYKFLLSIMNSQLLWWYLVNTGTVLANGYFRFKPNYLKPFRVPIISNKSTQKTFETLVDFVFYLKDTSNPLLINQSNNLFIAKEIEQIIDALVFELYFPEDFKKAGIEILKFAQEEFQSIEGLTEEEKKEIILNTYIRLTEKKNPLRNQIKLMKIELKQLLLPILSV